MPRNKLAWRRGVFVILILASLALLTLSFRQTESGPVHAVQEAGASLLSPLQSWGAKVAEPFQDGYQWLKTLWSAHQRAERLEEELQILKGEAIKLEEQGEENLRLRGLLDLRDKGTYPDGTDFKVARVIGKSPTRWQAWVQIDLGSADGIRAGLPVVGATPAAGEVLAGKGLVGKILSVTEHTSQVQLITDSESSVMAKIQGSRAEGIVEGSVSGDLIMDYVDRDVVVESKLVIVTSGYGPVYPADIPIGIVASVGEEDVNIYKEIEVRAFVDFRVLEEVMVLILPEGTTASSTWTTAAPTSTTTAPTSTTAAPTSTTSTPATTVQPGMGR
ncbi:MAG: rod shape-determining protein MreC [Actinobacteria bacterium]|nr:rod shape-determining protein MreC [Actinomycetota bacterium]